MADNHSILIIGGGVAGLAAGAELARAGWRVTLLEARERLGGRILTVQGDGVPLELGAEFIHGQSEPLWRLVQAAGVRTIAVADKNQLLWQGALQPVDIWGEVARVFQLVDPRAPDQAFAEFLETQDLPPSLKQLAIAFVQGFDAADPARISARSLRSSESISQDDPGAEQFRIANGYSALVEFLARELISHGGKVKTGTFVGSVRWRPGRVTVFAEQDGERITFESGAALVTLPLGVLKSGAVLFDPPLPEKTRAIETLEFGNVVKLALRFRRPFWPETDFGFIHAFSEAIPTWWSDSRGPLLTGWTGGPKADALSPWTTESLVEDALEILSRIFGVSVTAIRAELNEAHAHDWQSDPFSRGAYSYLPVDGAELPKILAAPVAQTLFFAGEATATDAEPGTVHGALATGLRAAREIQA